MKSWLHRGRYALAEDLRVNLDHAVVPPGTEQVFKTIKNRHRVRTTAALALVMVLVFGAVALAQTVQRQPGPPGSRAPRPPRRPQWTRALDLLPGANEWDVADDRITIGGTPYTLDGSALVRMG